MNFKKVLAMTIILMVLSISVGAVIAGSAIDMGKITSSDFSIGDVSSKAPLSSPVPVGSSGSAGSTQLYDVEFTADAQIDISKMSEADKKLLTKAVEDKNTSLIFNLSGKADISVELFQGGEFSIDGDTLKVHASTSYTSIDGSTDVELKSVGLRSSDNQLFIAKK